MEVKHFSHIVTDIERDIFYRMADFIAMLVNNHCWFNLMGLTDEEIYGRVNEDGKRETEGVLNSIKRAMEDEIHLASYKEVIDEILDDY